MSTLIRCTDRFVKICQIYKKCLMNINKYKKYKEKYEKELINIYLLNHACIKDDEGNILASANFQKIIYLDRKKLREQFPDIYSKCLKTVFIKQLSVK